MTLQSRSDANGTGTRPGTLVCPVCATENQGERECRICDADLAPLHRLSRLPGRFYDEGMACLRDGDADAAVHRLAAALVLDANRADVHLALAEAYAAQRQFERARVLVEEALRIQPDLEGARRIHEAVAVGVERAEVERQRASSRARRTGWLAWGLPAAVVVGVGLGITIRGALVPRSPAPVVASGPTTLPAGSVTERLWDAIAAEPLLAGLALRIQETPPGIVGTVPSEHHLRLVREVVRRVAGDGVDTGALRVSAGRVHRVRPGDTLSRIARRAYGTAALWPEIVKANPGRMAAPERLAVGQEIRLPAVTLQPR